MTITPLLRVCAICVLAVLASLAVACGDDDDSGPTERPTPTPPVEPTPAGEDDESQVRHTLELFVYYIDQDQLDDVCKLYTDDILSRRSCDEIKAGVAGIADLSGTDIKARLPSFESVEVTGDEARVVYTFCIDAGAGERCSPSPTVLTRTDEGWKIAGSF